MDTLLLHSATCSASWFARYLSSNYVEEKLVELDFSVVHLDLKGFAFLLRVSSFVLNLASLEIGLKCLSPQLTEDESYHCQLDIDEVANLFENLLRTTPPWLQPVKEANGDHWRRLLGQLNYVISSLRTGENNARAISRYNGEGLVPTRREVIELEEDGTSLSLESTHERLIANGRRNGLKDMVRRLLGGRSGEEEDNAKPAVFEDDGSCDDRTYSCSAAWNI